MTSHYSLSLTNLLFTISFLWNELNFDIINIFLNCIASNHYLPFYTLWRSFQHRTCSNESKTHFDVLRHINKVINKILQKMSRSKSFLYTLLCGSSVYFSVFQYKTGKRRVTICSCFLWCQYSYTFFLNQPLTWLFQSHTMRFDDNNLIIIW